MSDAMMKWGPNTDRVIRLLQWIESGELLQFHKILGAGFIPIADFNAAIEISQSEADGLAGWTEIRDQADTLMYEVGLLDTSAWLPYKAAISRLLSEVANRVDATLPMDYRDILDDVIADLHACTRCLAVHGRLDPFHEKLWQAYTRGSWPCGCTRKPLEADEPSLNVENRQFYVFWRGDLQSSI